MIGLYLLSAIVAWQIKEWLHGPASGAFIGISAAATIGGVLRGHLLFTESTHDAGLDRERTRIAPITLALDLLLAAALAADGLALAPVRELAAALAVALAIGLALARLVLEPATTRAAFDALSSGAGTGGWGAGRTRVARQPQDPSPQPPAPSQPKEPYACHRNQSPRSSRGPHAR